METNTVYRGIRPVWKVSQFYVDVTKPWDTGGWQWIIVQSMLSIIWLVPAPQNPNYAAIHEIWKHLVICLCWITGVFGQTAALKFWRRYSIITVCLCPLHLEKNGLLSLRIQQASGTDGPTALKKFSLFQNQCVILSTCCFFSLYYLNGNINVILMCNKNINCKTYDVNIYKTMYYCT